MTTESTSTPFSEMSPRERFLLLIEQNHGEEARKTAEEMGWVFVAYQHVDGNLLALKCNARVLCVDCLKQWEKSVAIAQELIDECIVDLVTMEKDRTKRAVFDAAESDCPHVRADWEMLRRTAVGA